MKLYSSKTTFSSNEYLSKTIIRNLFTLIYKSARDREELTVAWWVIEEYWSESTRSDQKLKLDEHLRSVDVKNGIRRGYNGH